MSTPMSPAAYYQRLAQYILLAMIATATSSISEVDWSDQVAIWKFALTVVGSGLLAWRAFIDSSTISTNQ
jgi:hypothetical protein